VSWSNNDPIYLYKKSDGVVVLNGATPDVGAYPQSGTQAQIPAPPTGLQATVQ
jgi:hypothetical protein